MGNYALETLVGRRLFEGETISETLAAVLRQDLPWDQLPAATPRSMRVLLARCLDRDPRTRLRDIGEARVALEGAEKAGEAEPAAVIAVGNSPRRIGSAAFSAKHQPL